MKNFLDDNVETIPVIGNIIATTLKGRHLIDIKINFDNQEDYKNFDALHMVIKRNENNFRNYPHQKYTFKVSKYKK